MLVFGPHFVASAMYYLPSPLREKSTQLSWIKFFSVITDIMMSSDSGQTGQFFSKHFFLLLQFTVPIDKIISAKNARAWVSMVSYLKKKKYAENMKKIVGAV